MHTTVIINCFSKLDVLIYVTYIYKPNCVEVNNDRIIHAHYENFGLQVYDLYLGRDCKLTYFFKYLHPNAHLYL